MGMPDPVDILGAIRKIEIIASGIGVRVRAKLKLRYGKGNWKKLKGIALIRDNEREIYEAEIHWYEAHGIGKRDFKIKHR
jgi:hypothetical protein